MFFKIKKLVDQYDDFFSSGKAFQPQNVCELGLFDGGSLAFWFEHFQLKKHVGVDLKQKTDTEYFRRYVKSKGLEGRLKTYWGVNQSDVQKLRSIVSEEFDGSLDLIIDDASHIYGPTKSSFEYLFPLLRPGGLYIIEDWAWEHWKEFHAPDHPWAAEQGLTKLIFELVEATGSSISLIKNLTVYEGFVVVERGEADLTENSNFKLDQYIARRPNQSKVQRSRLKLITFLKRILFVRRKN